MRKKSVEELVKDVKKDFEDRKQERSQLESAWLLNINFLMGNQYAELASNGDIFDNGKQFFWQQREVFNHIAPIIEMRLSKFASLRAGVTVRPATGDTNDVGAAKFATSLIKSVEEENNLREVISVACFWSEVAGTAFYKVVWNKEKGGIAAQDEEGQVFEGDADITACPPYEVYPDSLAASDIDDCASIIHAKAYPVKVIEDIWGVELKGRDVSVMNTDTTSSGGGYGYNARKMRVFSDIKKEHELVIERYSRPDRQHPEGRLTIVAGDSLLYDGSLPYKNLDNGARGFPFVRQVSINQPGCFYGVSIIERLVPVQRAYNSVKNRKHEFLNRLSLGVMAVEEGSIDLDNLEEEGLAPGKVLIYRQGSTPPFMMSPGSVPGEFRDEEDRLLAEFVNISGVNDFLSSESIRDNLSGIALNLLIEQDNARLTASAEQVRGAVKKIGQHILRLYRQFATTKRLKRVAGDNGEIERLCFSNNDITSDDLVFDTENELSDTPASRKNMAVELLKLGLLFDENGKLSDSAKNKMLEILGFGNWESARSTDELHIKKAQRENAQINTAEVEEIDHHGLHIAEHTRYLIGQDTAEGALRQKLLEHIRLHRKYQRLQKEADELSAAK